MNNIINNLYKPFCLLLTKLATTNVVSLVAYISITPPDQNYFNIILLKIINHIIVRICRYRETDSYSLHLPNKKQTRQKRVHRTFYNDKQCTQYKL